MEEVPGRKRRVKYSTSTGAPTSYGIFQCPFCGKKVERTLSNGRRDKSCGCQQRNGRFQNGCNFRIMYLGPPCKHGHQYKNTGQNLWYKANGGCVECQRIQNKNRGKEKIKKFIPKRDRERAARFKASKTCPKYRECLTKDAKKIKKMKCFECPDYVHVKNYYYRELGIETITSSAIVPYKINIVTEIK